MTATTIFSLDESQGRPADPSGVVRDAADWVIIGTGAGGGAIARILAEAGEDLILVEEGPPIDRRRISQNMYESARHAFRDLMTFAATGRAFVPVLQGMCVGGGTAINSAIAWRIQDKGYHRAFEKFGLDKAITRTDLDSAYDFLEKQLNVKPVSPDVAGRSNELMAIGSQKLGLEGQPMNRYEKDCAGSGMCQQACPSERKQSLDLTFIPYAVSRGARLYATCRAESLRSHGTRLTGVGGRFRDHETGRLGPRLEVEARKGVILAANAVQSPAILLRHRLGGPAVGRHFKAHPGSAVAGLYDHPVRPWTGATQGYEVLALREQGAKLEVVGMPPELMGVRLPGVGADYLRSMLELQNMAMWAAAILADSEGRVTTGPGGAAQVSYTLDRADMAIMRMGVKTLAEMHFAAGAKAVLPFVHGMPEKLTDPSQLKLFDEAPVDPRGYSMIASHLFGTCRMGEDPRTSVVGTDFRVHGTDNLYVTDASVFPSNIGVNPQHTIMALAALAGQALAEKSRPVAKVA